MIKFEGYVHPLIQDAADAINNGEMPTLWNKSMNYWQIGYEFNVLSLFDIREKQILSIMRNCTEETLGEVKKIIPEFLSMGQLKLKFLENCPGSSVHNAD